MDHRDAMNTARQSRNQPGARPVPGRSGNIGAWPPGISSTFAGTQPLRAGTARAPKSARAARIFHGPPGPPPLHHLPIPLPQIPLPNPAVLASGRLRRHPRKQARPSPSAARLQRNGGGNFRRLRPAPRAATGDRSRSLGGGSVALCSSYRCGPLSIGDCLDTAYPQPTHRCPGRALGPLLRGLPAPPPAPPPAAPRLGLP